MKRFIRMGLLLPTLMTGAASAQVFVAPFTGYSFATSEFDNTDQNTQLNQEVEVQESGHFGVMIGANVDTNAASQANAYLLFSRQSTELTGGDNFTSNHLIDLSVDYWHFGGSLYFAKEHIKPYVTVSAGVTRLSPDGDYSNESRFSMALGAGFEYQVTQNLALFADARGYATFVNSDNALFCENNQCQWHINADLMWQAQVNAGVKFYF